MAKETYYTLENTYIQTAFFCEENTFCRSWSVERHAIENTLIENTFYREENTFCVSYFLRVTHVIVVSV